jgi:hypothetical protein
MEACVSNSNKLLHIHLESPSPLIDITGLSLMQSAPIDAGKENPIVPNPPLEICERD